MVASNPQHGSAVYAELRDGDNTIQMIFTPAFNHPDNGNYVTSRLIYRNGSLANARRSWRHEFSPGKRENLEPSTLSEMSSTKIRQMYTVNQVTPAASLIATAVSANWKMYRTPLVFDLDAADLRQLADIKDTTPSFILRRIPAIRNSAGFTDSVYGDVSGEPPLVPTFNPPTNLPKNLHSIFQNLAYLHRDFGMLVEGVLLAKYTTDFKPYLDHYRPEGGLQNPKRKAEEPAEAPEPALGRADESYTRPNGQKYYTRSWGEHADVLALRKAREQGLYSMFYGEPGTGKSALCEAAFGEELITVIGSGDTEVSDLVGSYIPNTDNTFSWVDGPLLRAAEEGKVLLVDEVGLIDSKVLTILYGFMDGRKEYNVTANPARGTVKAADGFYVVAATNPNAPGVRLSEALLSRFTLQVEMTTDFVLARRLGVPELMVKVADNLNRRRSEGEVQWAPQLRELLAFRDVTKTFGEKFAIANLIASAPEIDRDLVVTQMERTFGEGALPARI